MLKYFWVVAAVFTLCLACSTTNVQQKTHQNSTLSMSEKFTNALASEASPYLQQHAHNPVNWLPWGDAAFDKAKKENKLVLVSIGYSACHWCHVMEHESFEDTTVANIMNEHFVCIKVDREERPDVDEIYMTAVQLMTQQGGWPLNCFTLPNGKPMYGGTYFRKEQWMEVLLQLSDMYQQEPEKVAEYANKLSAAVQQNSLVNLPNPKEDISSEWIQKQVATISKTFDNRNGGHLGAPKFPMPVEWEFLLEYGTRFQDENILEHVHATLEKMAKGGIYDQIGGGFARYSTDPEWKVPHFEKMLYDNGQLLALFSRAYRNKKNPLYQRIVSSTIAWMQREMLSQDGGFYAALDADSEGVEGKFYVWKLEELAAVLSAEELKLASDYFSFNKEGYWEEGNYIPLLTDNSDAIFDEHGLELERIQQKLLEVRSQRIMPGLDDKQLTSWNALAAIGLLESYVTFEDKKYLQLAEQTLAFINNKCWDEQKKELYHYYKKNGRKDADFLEDYAYYIQALLKAFEVTQKEEYLEKAKDLALLVATKFDNGNGFYFDRAKNQSRLLISNSITTTDNVTPSGNALMAKAWVKLGIVYYNSEWTAKGQEMANKMRDPLPKYPTGYCNWLSALLWQSETLYEVAITGENAHENALKIMQSSAFQVFVVGSENASQLPMLKDKTTAGNWIYVCENRTCKKPVTEAEEALDLMKP